jgi:hypothetical protein
MITRTRRDSIVFRRAFRLAGVGRELPAGNYPLVTDEELIEGLSFPAYRRVSTMMMVPAGSKLAALEMVSVDPRDLEAAQVRDRETAP